MSNIGKLLLALCGLLCTAMLANPAQAESFTVYRGVDASSSGTASLGPSAFRFNAELSVFDLNHRPASDCYVVLEIHNLKGDYPPEPGSTGGIAIFFGDGQHRVFHAYFDNSPKGHWEISPVTPGKNPADQFSAWAKSNRSHLVVNGTNKSCH